MNSIYKVESLYRGFNPIQILKHNYIFKNFFGIKLLSSTYDHVFDYNSSFNKGKTLICQHLQDIHKTELTSLKLNLFYAHLWMIRHAIQAEQKLKATQLDIMLNRMIKRDNVYIYSVKSSVQSKFKQNEFDSQIYDELKRMKRTVFRSLEDYFYFQNTLQRDLNDIIYLDILNEKETDSNNINSLREYIEKHIELMKQSEVRDKILKEQFDWKLQ